MTNAPSKCARFWTSSWSDARVQIRPTKTVGPRIGSIAIVFTAYPTRRVAASNSTPLKREY
jgi:hypothetical protein